ncbi:hypothetical protein GBAR_LOCUS17836 [Geodia barretti]|uniref:Uncharacterized protein n=1 Tax=Geodia barretti TaxID=519541 RepID=A0AA35SJV3_GEOBA|nr:hypothetical protein GBAR_LOCUS17836 [Geodia barretti]
MAPPTQIAPNHNHTAQFWRYLVRMASASKAIPV